MSTTAPIFRKRGKTPGPYWLNDKSEMYWEIVKFGRVHAVLERHSDDWWFPGGGFGTGNYKNALAMVERRNRKFQRERIQRSPREKIRLAERRGNRAFAAFITKIEREQKAVSVKLRQLKKMIERA